MLSRWVEEPFSVESAAGAGGSVISQRDQREAEYNRPADAVEAAVQWDAIETMIGLSNGRVS